MAPTEKPAKEKQTPVQRKDQGVSKGQKKKKKSNDSIGHRIRSLERLLKKIGADMAPGVKRDKEQELASLHALRTERARRANEASLAKQYRMLKFFERKKIERRLKQLNGKEDTESNEQRKKVLRDLRYVTEYPRDTKYVALFPSQGHTSESLQHVENIRKHIDATAKSSAIDENKVAIDKTLEAAEDSGAGDDFFLADDED